MTGWVVTAVAAGSAAYVLIARRLAKADRLRDLTKDAATRMDETGTDTESVILEHDRQRKRIHASW